MLCFVRRINIHFKMSTLSRTHTHRKNNKIRFTDTYITAGSMQSSTWPWQSVHECTFLRNYSYYFRSFLLPFRQVHGNDSLGFREITRNFCPEFFFIWVIRFINKLNVRVRYWLPLGPNFAIFYVLQGSCLVIRLSSFVQIYLLEDM